MSPRTAETHRSHVMHKLGLHNRTELIRFAIRRQMVPPTLSQQTA
jgi:DNA-binding CsgD family transcriptional regulator